MIPTMINERKALNKYKKMNKNIDELLPKECNKTKEA